MWGTTQTCEFACYQDECTGECVPETPDCISGDAYVCDEAGVYELDDDCTSPDEICRDGACVANDPYVVGENSITGYSNFNTPTNDRMYILPLVVPTTAVLLTFRVFVQAGSGNVRMVLYADDGTGQPGAQVKRSVLGTVASAVNGVVSMNAEGGNVQLTGGTTYWLGVVFFESGGSVETYSRTSTGLLGFSVPQAIGANPYADPFDIYNASSFNNIQLPIAIGVQDVSQ
jgi:hypothetical protein